MKVLDDLLALILAHPDHLLHALSPRQVGVVFHVTGVPFLGLLRLHAQQRSIVFHHDGATLRFRPLLNLNTGYGAVRAGVLNSIQTVLYWSYFFYLAHGSVVFSCIPCFVSSELWNDLGELVGTLGPFEVRRKLGGVAISHGFYCIGYRKIQLRVHLLFYFLKIFF